MTDITQATAGAAPAAPPPAADAGASPAPPSPPPAGGNGAAAPAAAPAAVPASAAADWRAGLEGEHKEFASRLASPADAVRVGLELRKQMAGMVPRPDNITNAEQMQRFHKAMGVPDNPEEYEFDIGREATDADKAVQAEVAKIALETHISKSQLKALSKGIAALAQAQLAEADRVALKAREDANATLQKEMGADYKGNLELARRSLERFGGPDAVNVIENATFHGAKLGDHPAIIRMFAVIGRRTGEAGLEMTTESERTAIQDRINALFLQNPPGTEKYKDPAVQRELTALHEKLHGTAPVAGFGGKLV